ncbi:MAG: glycosyltransferase [Robiginitalea sp.]
MQQITIKEGPKIADYQAYSSLRATVDHFLEIAPEYIKPLKGRTIWMINSTAIGGGVAEMLPSQLRILRSLGVRIEWLVIETADTDFFNHTKQIHNAIHGSGSGTFTEAARAVHERVNRKNLPKALELIRDGDIVVIHDPQPMPLAGMLKKERDITTIWRCHIGLEESNETTRGVWDYLKAYFNDYDQFIFSLKEYVLKEIAGRTSLIPPSIDPLSHKNRTLQMHKSISIMVQAGILEPRGPQLYGSYEHQVRRVLPDGRFGRVNQDHPFDLIYRPIITEISRWDRLKGFRELMIAFVRMKEENEQKNDPGSIAYKRIRLCRLVLGGPDPKFVTDDPEGNEVLQELVAFYKSLPGQIQEDIGLFLLPLDNPKENALIVNSLQRCSRIVVQNSLQEGFGLTATEAMWKQTPVLVSGAAGLRFQVQDEQTGKINSDPTDVKGLAETMEYMLNHPKELDKWAFNAQSRVVEHFTLFSQIEAWLQLFQKLLKKS